eukprot:m.39213 g.39213  ORF g.39213 m.39213 type:complete len:265 (-) comp13944_c0_seq1:38-832(-)
MASGIGDCCSSKEEKLCLVVQQLFSIALASTPPPFECSLDGGAAQPCTSPHVIAGPLLDGPHYFIVNIPGVSSERHDWVIDTTPPAMNFSSTPHILLAPNASANFVFTTSEPCVFECKLDDGDFEPCGSAPQSFATTLGHSVSQVDAGRHRLMVRSVDQADNVSPQLVFDFTFDACVTAGTCSANPCAQDSNPDNDGCACGPGSFLDLRNFQICRACTSIPNCQTNSLLHCTSEIDSVCGDCDDGFDLGTVRNFYDCRVVTIYT